MEKINILFISHEKDINGATCSMLDLISELRDQYNFYVLLRFQSGEVFEEIRKRKIKWFFCPYKWWMSTNPKTRLNLIVRKLKWKYIWKHKNLKEIKKMIEILKPLNIDIIHTNSSVTNFGAELSQSLKCKHIWHVREFGVEDFSTYPLVSEKEFYSSFVKKSDKVIVISDAVKKKYAGRIPDDKLIRIYNGVSTTNLYKKESYNAIAPLVILQSGVISKAKRQDIAIEAVKILSERRIKVILLLAGGGKLQDIGIDYADIPQNIEILGKISNLLEIRKNVDIEVVCSNCEAFGRVTVEGMMSSLTVIGANSGGTPELIKNGKTGFLFEKGEPIDLADKIELIHKNRSLLNFIGENAYAEADNKFSINRCANCISQVYQEVYCSR